VRATDLPVGVATGVGSMPGSDEVAYRDVLRLVADVLPDLPHLPELPGRGPGADLVGRGAAVLVDLPVDLQPHGWRLVDHAGRDARRAVTYLRSDLDDLAEAFDGYTGPFKLQVTGPWTLAASLWLPRGERALTDPGARREIVGSLAAGIEEHLAAVRAAVPGAEPLVQVDEPSLPAVLAGRLPRASGYGLVRALDVVEAEQGLAQVLAGIHAAGAGSAVHCCATAVPFGLLARAGAQALSLDLALLDRAAWEQVGELVDGGLRLWAGALPTSLSAPAADAPDGLPGERAVVETVRRAWQRLGLPPGDLGQVVLTPACGLAGEKTEDVARAILTRAVSSAGALAEAAHDA
jgi:hypothetical protein